jgi:hypothetical protein
MTSVISLLYKNIKKTTTSAESQDSSFTKISPSPTAISTLLGFQTPIPMT